MLYRFEQNARRAALIAAEDRHRIFIMPREKQKRGRRAETKKGREGHKRKREYEGAETELTKRQKVQGNESYRTLAQQEVAFENGDDYIPLEEESVPVDDTPFYGLLDSDEQEYFSRASQTLELNQFENDEDKTLFIDRVLEEANGKELKIACSQSCSRLMEKLISLSNASQLKHLFGKFKGHFLHLVQHRFASHCCERLFLRAAPIVTYEMKPRTEKAAGDKGNKDDEASASSSTMADLVLNAISELESNWGYLLTESFASHTIRVLLLILAGESVDTSSKVAVIASRKKENLDSLKTNSQSEQYSTEKRSVPQVFSEALEKMINDLVTGLDTTYLRALATHPVGSPVLQVLLMVELTRLGKERAKNSNSVIRRLIPDESLENTESATFINGLFYDPVGSRLLETLLRYVPGKFFKIIYKSLIRERIGSLSRNEIASYVVVRVLERLSKEDLQAAMDTILREVPSMVERSRLNVIKALIERGTVRGTDLTPLAEALKSAYGEEPILRLQKILGLDDNASTEIEAPTMTAGNLSSQQLHGSLLAQAMLQVPGPLADMIRSSLLESPIPTLVDIAKSPTASRVLQQSLTFSKSTSQFRRQIIPKFAGHLCDLALDTSGSHVVDTLWQATTDLLFLKQRLAEELLGNEKTLRDSFLGRAVWRNWSMDMYKKRRGEWMSKAKGLNDPKIAIPDSSSGHSGKPRSKLDLARERFAVQADQKAKQKSIQMKDSKSARAGSRVKLIASPAKRLLSA
ncbi:Nucleolar protein 9 [Emydomyces testavorans]|uniref:Nucleolar protein 9 n=1 Tax=Emydomyces testavorans TaxID=2070801 RepID=A0AAF0DBJ2_9EURO|nr:Nucleolar protein 9 [Emydomyces testavorans]